MRYICRPNYYMNFRRILVYYRLPIAIGLFALGFLLGFKVTWWVAWIPFLVSILMVVAYFMVGPMTLIQGYMEAGDMEGAKKLLKKVKFPKLLYKPIRSSFYMLQANFSTMGEDLVSAEAQLRQGLATGTEKEYEGTAYLQLGAIAQKKGNSKEALEHFKKAVQLGIPDKDNMATAYLQLCQIYIQRRDFRNGKIYFNKAKACKPTNVQVVDQIKELSKYIARIPG
jgi:tetratricopeptide (TPR) repeat protein